MATTKYSLEKGGAERLEVLYEGNFRNCRVLLDQNEIGLIGNCADLKAGRELTMPDGSILHVQLITFFIFPYIRVLRNGRILPSAEAKAAKTLGYAYKIIFLIGVLALVTGLNGVLKLRPWVLPAGNWLTVLSGIVFLILGFFVMRRSLTALFIAAGLFAIGTVITIFWHPAISGWIVTLGTIFKILILLGIIQGFLAIKVLEINQSVSTERG